MYRQAEQVSKEGYRYYLNHILEREGVSNIFGPKMMVKGEARARMVKQIQLFPEPRVWVHEDVREFKEAPPGSPWFDDFSQLEMEDLVAIGVHARQFISSCLMAYWEDGRQRNRECQAVYQAVVEILDESNPLEGFITHLWKVFYPQRLTMALSNEAMVQVGILQRLRHSLPSLGVKNLGELFEAVDMAMARVPAIYAHCAINPMAVYARLRHRPDDVAAKCFRDAFENDINTKCQFCRLTLIPDAPVFDCLDCLTAKYCSMDCRLHHRESHLEVGCKRQCRSCLVGTSGEFNVCGGCLRASYCERECQKRDWKKHREICASINNT